MALKGKKHIKEYGRLKMSLKNKTPAA